MPISGGSRKAGRTGPKDGPRDEALVGVYASSGEAALLEEYQKAGVQSVIVSLPFAAESEVFRALDTFSKRLSGWL